MSTPERNRRINILGSCLGRPSEETGQGLVEYSLILLFVAIALVGALGILATDIGNSILDAADKLGV